MVYAAALSAFAALPDDAAVAPIVALAALTGASQPPLGATVRSLWNQTLDDPPTRHVLFTGESAVLEAIYISGPVLIVAGIGGLVSISAAALACGPSGCSARSCSPPPPPRARGGPSPTACAARRARSPPPACARCSRR